uniref:Transducer of regulated CREB activity N-terminal domain-containing protein n=1 Tax=Clastoptera arizonana TaxID=38151 RepID=A0A1B6D9Y1_9HEMI
MANPRKFSEKIALHNQKQAEETAAFEKIMREVSKAISTSPMGNLEENMISGRQDGQMVFRDRSRERSIGVGGPIRSRPIEKRIDTSPYSGPYLSPPPTDTSWRRTNSDSALHTSAQANDSLLSPGSQRRVMDSHHGQHSDMFDLSLSPGRPRSCDVPRVPGINIYPSQQEPGTIQIPIGNNTGSLPDLTSFHFPSPLPTPLDQEDHNSPTYINNHLSVPSLVNSRLLHTCKGVTLENNNRDSSLNQHPPQSQSPQQHHQYGYHQRVSSPQNSPCSPHAQNSPLNTDYNLVNSLNSYRSPQPVSRPSPQNSPSLTVKYGSASPLSSSPQSPSSPPNSGANPFSEHNSYYISQAQAAALQQHFEQFSMMDSPGTIDYIDSTNNTSPYSQTDETCTQVSSQELTPDPGYFSTSPSQQLQYSRHSAQTTPNTPSSIPDIVLTDFSNTGDDLACRAEAEFAKELGCAIGGSFDSDIFSPSDECLRQGLDPIDLDGLQMLTDPEIITDPATEDHFGLDRL